MSKSKTKKSENRASGSLERMVRHPATSSINRMKRLYRKLCEEHPDPKVQRIAQAMESALRWATEDTRGWRMKEEPMLLAQCLAHDMETLNDQTQRLPPMATVERKGNDEIKSKV